ncbi:MAG TPA: RNA methyltransferase [Bryobacteraceae bacterium]|nr:RNA methyltransferase [Bryobacteraceae bacterium]
MPKAEAITSAANPLLKDIRRAVSRGGLTSEGWCVAETFHLLEEALRSDCEVKVVLAAETVRSAAESHVRGLSRVKVVVLTDTLFQALSGTETSQGVMALVKPPVWNLEQLFRGVPLVVILDGLQDPGNGGAIVRTAEAFGATGVLFLKGSVNPYNPKTLRASAGSLFRIPFLHAVDSALALAALRQHRVELYAGVPAQSGSLARSLSQADLTGRCGLIIGSEAHGVSGALRSAALDISIPTVGVESLNAAVAAGILLYEARRQRVLRA